MQRATAAQVRVDMASRQSLDHMRELRLRFEEGHTAHIRLDHGLSFFQYRGPSSFAFRAASSAQVEELRRLEGMLAVRHGQRVIAYVGG